MEDIEDLLLGLLEQIKTLGNSEEDAKKIENIISLAATACIKQQLPETIINELAEIKESLLIDYYKTTEKEKEKIFKEVKDQTYELIQVAITFF